MLQAFEKEKISDLQNLCLGELIVEGCGCGCWGQTVSEGSKLNSKIGRLLNFLNKLPLQLHVTSCPDEAFDFHLYKKMMPSFK